MRSRTVSRSMRGRTPSGRGQPVLAAAIRRVLRTDAASAKYVLRVSKRLGDYPASFALIRAFVRKKKSTSSMIANDIDADVSQNAVQSRVIVPSAAVFEK